MKKGRGASITPRPVSSTPPLTKFKMPNRAKRWCFTLNNYTDGEVELLDQLFQSDHVTYGVYGFETGASGTPHLQGFVVFEQEKRLTQVKRLVSERAHFEVARGTPVQAADYCKKDGDFKEYGECPTGRTCPTKKGKWDQLVEWIQEINDNGDPAPTEAELCIRFPGLMGPNRRGVIAFVASLYRPPSREIGHPHDGWQREFIERIEHEPDDRSVMFYVDPEGNNGKSWICRYLKQKYPEKVQILRIGKKADLAYSLDPRKSIILFDIPRRGMEYLQYQILEEIKDGEVYSPKYDSQSKVFGRCHVVVFCNEYPDLTAMTTDRYKITKISEDSQQTFNP